MLELAHYITHMIMIVNHLQNTNDTYKLWVCALQNLLYENQLILSHLIFDLTLAVREYVIIHQFSVDTTLNSPDKHPHESLIIDLFKEESSQLITPLTL